jgi:type IV pilus assembly protein PilM
VRKLVVRKKSFVGVDIGSTAARAAEVTAGSPRPALVRAAQVPLPLGAVENGEVRQPAVVAEALKELWARGGFKTKQIVMGVGNQRVVVREVSLPWLPEKELRQSLAYQVQEFIPMATDEAVLDFDPIGEFEADGRRMLRMLLVAAQKVMIGATVEAAEGAKLEPVGIDLVPFALVRAVGNPGEGMELEQAGDEAVIDVGAHVTNICVHDKGITRFVRILPSGGRDITVAVARALNVPEESAELLKRGEDLEDGPAPDHVRRAAIDRAGAFVDEIRSSLEFYAAQVPGSRIQQVLVTGGGSKLEGFLELLRERIPVPIERGRALERVESKLDLSPEAIEEAEPVLPVAVGLAIPGKSP